MATFVSDSGGSEAALATTIQNVELATKPGDLWGHTIAHCDVDLLTKSITAPHIR